MRRSKPLPSYLINGWIVDKQPNSFGSRYMWEATAVDAEGYQTARHGFQSLHAARAFCEATEAPRTR